MAFKMKAGKEGPFYKNYGIGKKSPMPATDPTDPKDTKVTPYGESEKELDTRIHSAPQMGEGGVPEKQPQKNLHTATGVPDVNIKGKLTGKEKWKTKRSGKKTIKIRSIDAAEDSMIKGSTGSGEYVGPATAVQGEDWEFQGDIKQDKDISSRKRKAVYDPETGITSEKYKSRFGFYRPTGRTIDHNQPEEDYEEMNPDHM